MGQGVVGHEGAGQAGDDHDLLHGRQAPADVRGGDFRDVDRAQHAGRADAQAADQAEDHEDGRGVRRPGAESADDEQHGRDDHHGAAAPDVGQAAGGEGADGAADQDGADVQTGAQFAEVEGALKAFLRTVDDAAVVTEHEAADRGDRDDRGDEGHIHLRPVGAHARAGAGVGYTCHRFPPIGPSRPVDALRPLKEPLVGATLVLPVSARKRRF